MNRISLKLFAACVAGLASLAAQGQPAAGMNPPVTQVEAIESHLQQSRTQASKDSDGAKKKPKTYELPPAVAGGQASKQKKSSIEGEKQPAPTGAAMKKE